MIEEKYIQAALQESWYQRKAGTSSSYYKAGSRILPNRLSIRRDELTYVRKEVRNLIHPVIGYGSIGISNEEGTIDLESDSEDLIILEAEDHDWERIRIFNFPAMIKALEEVMTHLSKKFTKKIY